MGRYSFDVFEAVSWRLAGEDPEVDDGRGLLGEHVVLDAGLHMR